MKKIISLGLVVLLLGSILGGCSRAEENTKNENLPEIIVGCDNYSPFSYADANGEMTGIDVELAREAFSRMGVCSGICFHQLGGQEGFTGRWRDRLYLE